MTGHRLLIIDRDEANIKFLDFNFQKEGYLVFTASNMKEGLIEAFKNRPHVIIFDPQVNDIPFAEFVRKLRKDRRVTKSKLIAFSSLTKPEDIQKLQTINLDHCLTKESNAFPVLNESVKDAIHDLISRHPAPQKTPPILDTTTIVKEKEGKIIVFLSAKGGTGTSSICANLAHISNERKDQQVAVVDLVLPIGSIATIVGYQEPFNIVKAAAMDLAEISPNFLKENLHQPERWNFHLLAGSPDPKQANDLDVSRIPDIINIMKKSFDFIFIDLGRSLSRISLPIIQSADQIVLILSLDEATALLTYSLWDFLQSISIKKEDVYMLINRAIGLEGFSKAEVEEKLGVLITNSIPHLGREFTIANNMHQPILDKLPDDAAIIAMRQAVREINQKIKI